MLGFQILIVRHEIESFSFHNLRDLFIEFIEALVSLPHLVRDVFLHVHHLIFVVCNRQCQLPKIVNVWVLI